MTTDYTTPEPVENRIARYKMIADSYPDGHREAAKIYAQIEQLKKQLTK